MFFVWAWYRLCQPTLHAVQHEKSRSNFQRLLAMLISWCVWISRWIILWGYTCYTKLCKNSIYTLYWQTKTTFFCQNVNSMIWKKCNLLKIVCFPANISLIFKSCLLRTAEAITMRNEQRHPCSLLWCLHVFNFETSLLRVILVQDVNGAGEQSESGSGVASGLGHIGRVVSSSVVGYLQQQAIVGHVHHNVY